MSALISIIMPAYRAQATLVPAVQSVCAQTYPNWELIIVADDRFDYAALLATHGIYDQRIRHTATGMVGSGGPALPRNVGVEQARSTIIAVLDSDDAFAPTKLERCLPHVARAGVVSCGLVLRDEQGHPRRMVGTGNSDVALDAAHYKRVNLSSDVMLLYDRQRVPARWDTTIGYLEDIEFVLQCFQYVATVYHVADPLHYYTKSTTGMSASAGAGEQFIAAKQTLLQRIESGYYRFPQAATRTAFAGILAASLAAERAYIARRATEPDLLFEDVLETQVSSQAIREG